MLNKILLNQFINAIGLFAEKRLVCRGTGDAGVEADEGTDSPAERATQQFFSLLDKTAKHDEAQMDEQEKEVWLKEQKEKSTKEFRTNLEKSRASLPSDLPYSDYEVADLFIRDLRSSYSTVEAQSHLLYVDPAFDNGSSVTTGPKEDPLEIRVDVKRGGGDTRALPDYMWVKYKVVDGVPGVEVRWTEDKDPSGNGSYNHVPLATKEDAARIATLPKAKDMKIEGVEYLGMLKDGLGTDNPYAKYLQDALVNSKIDFSKIDVKKIVRKSDRLVLQYTEEGSSTEKELEFGGYEYRAIFWGEISRNIGKLFAGKTVPVELMAMAARDPIKNPKFDKLVEAIAIDSSKVKESDALAKEAFAELEHLRPMLNPEGAKGRRMVRSGIERAGAIPDLTEKDIKQLESGLANKTFVDSADVEIKKFGDSLEVVKREVLRETYKIDANQWRPNDLEGISRTYNDWSKLGLPVGTPFYGKMFCLLRDGLDASKNPHLKNPETAALFKNPENHIVEIQALRDPSGFAEAYATAIGFFMSVKQNILGKDDAQLAMLDKQRKMDEEPITQKAIDVVRDNFNKFTKSIREGDYATAGVYVVGIWATYKALSSLFGSGDAHGAHGGEHKGFDWKKWAIYGIAGYAGYIFAKNAGYDVLKMSGMKRGDDEVAGTALEAIPKIIAQLHLKEAEDLDYDVAARMSEVKVTDLYGQYQEANKHGIRFIHPNQFPQIFPNLKNVGFFDLGIGEAGLADHEGNSNKRLSTQQREYIRVGRQLYKLMMVIEKAYPETIGKETHMSFDDALKTPVVRDAKIRHLFAGIGVFVNPASSEYGAVVDYARMKLAAERDLTKAFGSFKEYPTGFTVEPPDKALSGGMRGTIMGYPVVFLYDAAHKRYQVYFANEFKTDEQVGRRTPIAEIPADGGALQTEAVKRVAGKVKSRMENLLSHLDSKYGKPEFDGTQWTAKMKLSSMPEFGVEHETPVTAIISTTDGKNLTIEIKEVGAKFNMDEAAMKADPEKFILMTSFLSSPIAKPFSAFAKSNKLNITDVNKGASTFKLELTDVGTVTIKFERGVGFKMDPEEEKALIRNEKFGRVYIECLENDKDFELNKVVADLETALDNADQSFAKNLWDSLIEEGFSLGAFTGSIANNLSKSVLAVTKYEALQNIRRALLDPSITSIKDAEKVKADTLIRVAGNLRNVIAKLNGHDENWKKHEFNFEILAAIREANSKSDVYARTRQGLERDLYADHTSSDFVSGAHKTVENQMKVFSYFTSYLDTRDLDKVRSGVTLPANAKTNPDYKPYFIYNYLKYVRENVSAKKFSSPEDVPAPTAYGIMEFDDYMNSAAALVETVDVVDNRPPLKHTLELRGKPGEGYTELDVAIAEKVRTVFRRLQDEYGDALKPGAVEAYLTKDPTAEDLVKPDFNPGRDSGLFSIYRDPVSRKPACRLWEVTDKIAAEVSTKTIRGDQEQIIDKAIEEYVIRYIFQHSELIFKDPQTAGEWIAKNWPWMDRQIRRVGAWWDDDEPPEDTAPTDPAGGGRSYDRYGR